MVKIQNSDAIKAIRDGARLSISEGFPEELGKTCVPVMDMTPNFHRVCQIVRHLTITSTANDQIIYTIPAQKDFFLVGCHISCESNATADNLTINIKADIDGATRQILGRRKLTTTAGSFSTGLTFPTPVKIDRGSNITYENQFSVGASVSHVSIIGYEVDR